MNYINITVRGKIARAEGRARVVCGNSDYTVRFDFDAEWTEYTVKTARFVTEDGSYTDVQFEGDTCAIPILRNTRTLLVGAFAGNLRTTTAALIHAVPCITDPDGTPADPTPDVYAQLMERFNAMEAPAAVLYTAQELTDEQKATARENIGVATPDWEQSDEDQPDYIKHRPFYDDTVILPFASTPTTGAWEIAPTAADEFFSNISSYTVRYNGVDYHFNTPVIMRFRGMDFQGVGGKLDDNSPPFMSYDIPFVIYRPKVNGSYDGTSAYVGKSMSKPPEDIKIFRSNLKQLDPKFLPANRFIVRVTQDGNGNFTADKTSAEIIEAYEAGKDVVASFAALNVPLYAIAEGKTAVFDVSVPGQTSQGLIINDTVVRMTDELHIPKIYPDEATDQMNVPVGVDSDGKLWSKADTSLNMTGATVGQIAKITAVDDSGKPTAWEAVDMPSGGSQWVEIIPATEQTLEEAVTELTIPLSRSDTAKGFELLISFSKSTADAWSGTKNTSISINGQSVGYFIASDDLSATNKNYAFVLHLDGMPYVEKVTHAAGLEYNLSNALIQTIVSPEQTNDGKLTISFSANTYQGTVKVQCWGLY